MKKLILGALGLLALCTSALAQTGAGPGVNTVPQIGVSTAYLSRATYSAIWVGLVPPASATDEVCISGSATKTIRLQSIRMTGTATTAINLPMTILRRVSLDTGGTAATTTANPANTIGKRDPSNAAATATLVSYTAVPTIVDTSPTYLASGYINIATSATLGSFAGFDWAKDTENFLQPPMIPAGATTQQICLNLNATSIGAAGTTTGEITWTEE